MAPPGSVPGGRDRLTYPHHSTGVFSMAQTADWVSAPLAAAMERAGMTKTAAGIGQERIPALQEPPMAAGLALVR